MARINSFEEIEAWKTSRQLIKEIYGVTNQNNFSTDYSLKDQIRRSAVSVSANIAEGFERETTKEFIRFLYISKASCGELRSHLYTALDLNYINQTQFNELKETCISISKMLSKFITYLKSLIT